KDVGLYDGGRPRALKPVPSRFPQPHLGRAPAYEPWKALPAAMHPASELAWRLIPLQRVDPLQKCRATQGASAQIEGKRRQRPALELVKIDHDQPIDGRGELRDVTLKQRLRLCRIDARRLLGHAPPVGA